MADPINSGDTWAVIRGKFNSLIADVAAAVASVAGKLTASSNLSDIPNKAAARTALELGSMAQQAANAVGINGGTISGVTISGLAAPLSVSDGGTGGTTQSAAQDGLGAGATGKAVFVAATPAIGRSALAVAAEVDTLLKSGNFAGLADVDASLGNLGFSAFVRGLRAAADQAAFQAALGLGGLAVKSSITFSDLAASALASLADAQDGTDNTKLMTPLRSRQADEAFRNANALGWGQTWQDVTGSRSASTSYQNTTGRPIAVAIHTNGVTGNHALEVSTNNLSWLVVSASGSASALISTNRAIVPPGHYYRYTGNIAGWTELR